VNRRLAAAVLALACAGWETRVREPEPPHIYVNAYEGAADAAMTGLWRPAGYDLGLLANNEHRELTAIALLRLGWGSLLSETPPKMIDLNASVWRPRAREALQADGIGDDLATPLVERTWPGITRFAGLPDYAYAMHDWINATTLCPALPPDATERDASCYVYAAWHGAALNSSHFGDQATRMYRHYHELALSLAADARQVGLAAAVAEDRDEMLELVRAAERQALAFEAVAQHYLQDRWSMGHAWNRWNGPRHADQSGSGKRGLFDSVSTGLIAGFLHGAEAALRRVPIAGGYIAADPMCSPLFTGDGISVLEAAHGDGTIPMIGDDRLRDALDGGFGREYGVGPDAPDHPLDVSTQLEDMLRCSMAGWGDVVRGFHLDGGRSYGLGLAITPDTPTFGGDPTLAAASGGGVSAPCWDMWATNDAVRIGIETLGQGKLVDLAVKPGVFGLRLLHPRVHIGPVRLDWRALWLATNRIRRVAQRDPGGTDLARGVTLPDLLGARPGQHYLDSVPMDYSDPSTPSALPWHADHGTPAADDRPGRDRHALHGFFHQAQSRFWCDHSGQVLPYDRGRAFADPQQGLRWPVPLPGGSAGPSAEQAGELARRLDACVLLADRAFEHTGSGNPLASWTYTGDQREDRRVGHGDDGAQIARSPCALLNGGGVPFYDGPAQPHPGYVSRRHGPHATDLHYGAPVYRSTKAWCQALPVIHVDDEDYAVGLLGDRILVTPGYTLTGDISFAPDVLDPLVTIRGYNFGNERGRLKLESEHDCVDPLVVSPYPEIASWTDTQITFRLDQTRFPPDTWTIEVIRDDKDADLRAVRSVGRFRLDVRHAVFSDLGAAGGPLPVDVTGQSFRSDHPFCAGGDVIFHQIVDCTDLSGPQLTACGASGGPGTVMWTGPAPMSDFLAGPYPEHRYAVQATGECGSLFFPAPCPTAATHGVRLWYGAVHHLQRTSTSPIGSPPPRTWRYTLGWRRYGFGQ